MIEQVEPQPIHVQADVSSTSHERLCNASKQAHILYNGVYLTDEQFREATNKEYDEELAMIDAVIIQSSKAVMSYGEIVVIFIHLMHGVKSY